MGTSHSSPLLQTASAHIALLVNHIAHDSLRLIHYHNPISDLHVASRVLLFSIMRPLFGETPSQGARAGDSGVPQQPASSQMAYFFGDEDTVDAALQQSLSSLATPRDPRKQQQQHGGAGFFDSTPNSPSKHAVAHDRDCGSISAASSVYDNDEHPDDASLASDVPVQKPLLAPAAKDNSRPITPLMLAASGPASAISGVSSRRNSVTASLSEENASQALSMSMELEPEVSPSMMDSGSAPQLVMPSIKMPSRRPFTEEGKRIGRLKVLIAGDSGRFCLLAAPVSNRSSDCRWIQALARRHLSKPSYKPRMLSSTSIQ